MSDGRASSPLSPLSPGSLATMQKVIVMTESQIETVSALVETLNEDIRETQSEQRQLQAELATRRRSLLEWTQSRDRFSRAYQYIDSGGQSQPHETRIREREDNPTVMPSDDELAQMLVAQNNSDMNAIRLSMDTRESTISILRSRIEVLEEDIAGCRTVISHTESMIAQQASHKAQLQALLAQYKSRPPIIERQSTVEQAVQTPYRARLLEARLHGLEHLGSLPDF